jgi:hypothetical protein
MQGNVPEVIGSPLGNLFFENVIEFWEHSEKFVSGCQKSKMILRVYMTIRGSS